jgi:hypothetical protein
MGRLHKEPLTIIHPYYGQKEMIPLQMEVLDTFPELRIVFVDDGSPEALQSLEKADVYRINEDIPWNQSGARNLGFYVSEGWILYSDIDHIVTPEVINSIRNRDWDKNCIYYLGRTENGKEVDTAYNCYFIHKEAFDKIGGYDEDFAGGYGFEDTLFYTLAKKFLEPVSWDDIRLVCRADIGSSELERSFDRNGRMLDEKLIDLKPVDTPKLRFTWKKL